jgi:hypothetical protein
MTRRPIEVNAIARFLLMGIAIGCGVWGITGCASDERRAERMHRLALEELDEGNTEAASAHLREIVERYPATEAATKARKRLALVQGLHEAVEKYPRRRTQDAMVEIGRALERFRAQKRAYPSALEELVPTFLPEGVPPDGWGRPVAYEARVGGRGYRMVSSGADGFPGGEGEDRDVVVVNGKFQSGAEG